MNRNPNMPRFLLASLCLHLAIAVPWLSAFQFSGHRETVLTVTLDAPERPIAPVASRAAGASLTVAEKNVIAEIAPIMTPAPAMAHTAPHASAPENKANKDSTSDDSDGAHTESARAQIQAQLLVELQRYFEYPLLARRRGWEGTVLLSFVVESDGALRRIQVARGSGYDLLDNSAVAAVHRVERLTEARHWLDGRSLQMDIPVIYRLKER
jgi:protein TonB